MSDISAKVVRICGKSVFFGPRRGGNRARSRRLDEEQGGAEVVWIYVLSSEVNWVIRGIFDLSRT